MGTNSLLILNMPGFNARLNQLGERLTRDTGLRELYVQDPGNVILKTIFPEQNVASAEVTRGNRLLFALLTNDKFMVWAGQYQRSLVENAIDATTLTDPTDALRTYLAVVDRSAVHRDLAAAIAQTADTELIAALTWRPDHDSGLAPDPRASFAVDVETFIYAVGAVAVFVAAVAAVVVVEAPGHGVGVSRAEVRNVANQLSARLVAHGHELRASGALTQFSARNAGFIR